MCKFVYVKVLCVNELYVTKLCVKGYVMCERVVCERNVRQKVGKRAILYVTKATRASRMA